MSLKCCIKKKKFCKKNNLKIKIKKPNDYEYFKPVKSLIVECKNCEVLRQQPTPTKTQINSFYDEDYQNYTNSPNILLRFLSKIYFKISSFALKVNKNSYILDYGCGTGEILNNFSKSGYKNLYASDFVRHKNLEKKIKFSKNIEKFKNIKFDLIIINHVIEHVPDPLNFLLKLKSKLKPKGKIIGQTPNYKDFTFNLFGDTWGALHQPYHLNLFSKISLKKLCSESSLNIKISQAFMPTGISMSLENLIKKFFNIKRKGRLKIYPFLILCSLFINLFLRIFNNQGSIVNFEIYN